MKRDRREWERSHHELDIRGEKNGKRKKKEWIERVRERVEKECGKGRQESRERRGTRRRRRGTRIQNGRETRHGGKKGNE